MVSELRFVMFDLLFINVLIDLEERRQCERVSRNGKVSSCQAV